MTEEEREQIASLVVDKMLEKLRISVGKSILDSIWKWCISIAIAIALYAYANHYISIK